ncbi:OmpW/AlkL family protein [Asticcacaulis benevestitus]|nr:OmpW family outer membrane protein [Asticcacaulis benevestitus]
MNNKLFSTAIAMVALLGCPMVAMAEAPAKGFVHLGLAHGKLADKGTTYSDGVAIPGGGSKSNEYWPVVLEGGYFVSPHFALQGSISTPETTHNIPTGSMAGLPNLGDDQFTNLTFTATYHPWRGAKISPYIGAGFIGHITLREQDGLVKNLHVQSTSGTVIQAGFDYSLTSRYGLYFDVKKATYTAKAWGDLGASKITATTILDPVIVQAGASWRF